MWVDFVVCGNLCLDCVGVGVFSGGVVVKLLIGVVVERNVVVVDGGYFCIDL